MSGYGDSPPTQYPAPQYPSGQYPPTAPSPGAPQTPVPAPSGRRAPLTARQSRGALVAGGVMFPVISLGWALMVISVVVGGAYAALVTYEPEFRDGSVGTWWPTVVAVLLPAVAIAAVAGAIIWTLGLLFSRVILRRTGHPRPWAITWLALLVAVLVSGVLDGVAQAIVGAALRASRSSSFYGLDTSDPGSIGLALAGAIRTGSPELLVTPLVALVVAVAVGMLAWRLLAAALRGPDRRAGADSLAEYPGPR